MTKNKKEWINEYNKKINSVVCSNKKDFFIVRD